MDLWKKTVSGRKEGGLKGCFHGNKRIEPQKTASVSAWRHLDLQDLDMVFCGSIFFQKKLRSELELLTVFMFQMSIRELVRSFC